MMVMILLLVAISLLGLGLLVRKARRRGLDRWLVPYIVASPWRRATRSGEDVHVLLCVADHYEPFWGKASPSQAATRVANWVRAYPRLFGEFRDSDGRPPRHTFFYPHEEYDAAHTNALADLCRAGFGEVEVHLHHHDDTAAGLRAKLIEFRDVLAERHGLLARRKSDGAVMYGFIHGNWALCNARPDGRLCGVNDELTVLHETGCYADFTFPSAPHPSQPRKLNSIYYASSTPHRPGGHFRGWNIGRGRPPESALLLIQGPLVLHRGGGGWRPRLENGCLQESQPPSIDRLDKWLRARVQVPGRPDWFFVKLHAHGAQEDSQRALLGPAMVQFHRDLAARAEANPRFHYHYVSAREMYNLARAAEAGWKGPVYTVLDYELLSALGPRQRTPESLNERNLGVIPKVAAGACDVGL